MDREILFRGKRMDNAEWVYGFPIYDLADCSLKKQGKCKCAHNGELITFFAWEDDYHEYAEVEVDPSTVGQYTGLNDENGKKIFEGDYLGDWGENENGEECICIMGVVTYRASEGRYVLADENGLYNDWTLEDESQPENWNHLIHCGNIHDNPELIGGEGDG